MTPDPELPTRADFCPFDDLDARSAWGHFGGLDLAAARARLADNPLALREDFQWMGARAFAFYWPVLVDQLDGERAAGTLEPEDLRQVAGVVAFRLEGADRLDAPTRTALAARLEALTGPLAGSAADSADPAAWTAALAAWRRLVAALGAE